MISCMKFSLENMNPPNALFMSHTLISESRSPLSCVGLCIQTAFGVAHTMKGHQESPLCSIMGDIDLFLNNVSISPFT